MTQTVNKPAMATQRKSICLMLNPGAAQQPTRTIVVLGVERGGTSMAAGVIRALGISMGDRAGLNHEDPQFLTDDETLLRERIEIRNQAHATWGFKVPKASLQTAFFDAHLRNPHYVIVYRNALSVVDSWVQRGAGETVDVLERVGEYQAALAQLMRTTEHPILLVNYERAVAGEAAKSQLVEELADFCGVPLDDDLAIRARGMMTGDGQGYVNLPEHFFLIEPWPLPADRDPIALTELSPEERDADGWAVQETQNPILKFRPADGSNLPKAFWLDIDLESDGIDLETDPLRVYFNLTGHYFPGHCARPKVRHGRNSFWVETSGNATDLAFGPLTVPARLRIGARMYAASNADQPANQGTPAHKGSDDEQNHGLTGVLKRMIGR